MTLYDTSRHLHAVRAGRAGNELSIDQWAAHARYWQDFVGGQTDPLTYMANRTPPVPAWMLLTSRPPGLRRPLVRPARAVRVWDALVEARKREAT